MSESLFIKFSNENGEILAEWKRKIWGLYGKGGLTKKLLEFIKSDLEKIKNEVKTEPTENVTQIQ